MSEQKKKPTLEEAQAWAERRANEGETVTVMECPHCKEYVAVYTAHVDVAQPDEDTNSAMPVLVPE